MEREEKTWIPALTGSTTFAGMTEGVGVTNNCFDGKKYIL